ncbi:hypothetical protein QJS10_CPA16g00388 [Acorus calamus]|uniref:Uncharacterized protein n=1 Tax=Acorus calamus TaxID=4465 RepID=A0AAV9CYR1_ACOCL|nr:hypothetical protein QJS10_CPA16g00388 [Acorus calamus]
MWILRPLRCRRGMEGIGFGGVPSLGLSVGRLPPLSWWAFRFFEVFSVAIQPPKPTSASKAIK